MLQEALGYSARGWRVFPLHGIDAEGRCTCGRSACPDAGKHPRNVGGFKEASADPAQIALWFGAEAPPSNIGIATGEGSGLTVIDVDIGAGKQGAETWAALIAEHGEPQTLMAQTGSGGMHVFFRYNSALKTSGNTYQHNAALVAAGVGKGVDCRNDGGYIVAPPSRHRSGGVYAWLNDLPVAALPAHLVPKRDGRGRPRKDDPKRQKYTVEQVRSMLEHVPADDRDMWRSVGIILGRTFNRIDAAWELYNEWSGRWEGKKGRGHDEIMHECFYELSQQAAHAELSVGTIVHAAMLGGWAPKIGEVPIDNFVYYGPGNNFIYRPTNVFWAAEAVNAAVSPVNEDGNIIKAAEWLRRNALCTSMTNDPLLEGDFVAGVDYRDGTTIRSVGAATFNTYRPASIEPGDARLAGPFLRHLHKVFPNAGDVDQFLNYMAHRAQKPGEKPRFALLIAGEQGVGKDTAVEMCCPAIGHWNVANIEPGDLDSGFNAYASAVLVRISEAANLHDMTKWAFNERMKVLIAGTPDYMTVNPKYGQQYSVRLHCGVIVTTNHLHTGIYIPDDDRRYDVIESATKYAMGFTSEADVKQYFAELWSWFYDGGAAHVAAFLMDRDLSKFSAANGQRKTEAHAAVVTAGKMNDYWLYDALVELGEPDAVRVDAVAAIMTKEGLAMKEYANRMPTAMARAGYYMLRNPDSKDGRWQLEGGKRTTIYVKTGFDLRNFREAKEKLAPPPF